MRAAFEEYNKAAEVLGRRPVLLMDECDSLLLRRVRNSDGNSGISNAMANVVNVALQEIEQFRGTLIMTTNDIESIDPAFARRVDESIKLDYPSKDTQRKMWAKYLTINAPGVDSVDIEVLLNAGSLTGAHIVKCVERAVKHKLITSGDSFVLSTGDFIREIRQELRSFDRSLLAKNDIKAEDVLQESRSSSFGFV
jgi:SpoVK/Ycf46/Vps4 family AAA+-type ATPase